MATIEVQPRNTPAERHDETVEVEIDEAIGDHAAILEDWAEPRPGWTCTLREGHEFGRANNVEVELLFAARDQTSSLGFRLEQLLLEAEHELLAGIRRVVQDGIAKLARLTAHGLDVELFHVLTFT